MNKQCPAIKKHWIFHAVLILAAVMVTALPADQAAAQDNRIVVDTPEGIYASDAITQALSAAETLSNDAIATMNEDTLRRAASDYEEIIEDFPNDDRHFDAYFASVYIHMEYLQGRTDYEHSRNLLHLLINNHPSNYSEVADARLTLAHLNYRCLRDYGAAQENLSELLNNRNLSAILGSREGEVKTLLAKCRQKLGDFDQAVRLWEELEFINPGIDTEGRLNWIRNSINWYQLDDGRIRLFFENTIERSVYSSVLNELHTGLAVAESTWGLLPGSQLDVFLYKSADALFDYTDRSNGFTLAVDQEIHISVDDIGNISYLTGFLVSGRLNTRPDGTVFPLLRAGFNNYFMGGREEIDRLAAHEIYFYGGLIDGDQLLFPLSFDYTYSEEYQAMAASFMHYLLEEGRVEAEDLEVFFRLLWANPEARIRPPLITEIQKWLSQVEGEAVGWQESLATAEYIYEMAELMLGLDIPEEIELWQQTLEPDIRLVEAELGSLTADVSRVDVDLSTPEKALETWWNATRSGDFDAMIQSSTRDVGTFLEEARAYYVEEGILDQVILEYFIRPYRSARMVVTRVGTFADDLYVYEVDIEMGDVVEQKTLVVRQEGNLWKVDSN